MTTTTFEPPTIGDVLGEGRFQLLARLGDGGTSNVFRARDRFLDRDVALKLLHPKYVGRPEREQRLINEAEYLRRVQGHPHIVEYIDSGRLPDLHSWPWLATEVLSGTVLGWVLVRGRLGVARTISVARQLLEALLRCHAEGIVHRDTTPNNVFELDDAGKTVKLFDFSHAADFRGPRVAVGAPERLTGIFDVPGTHGYMGPEQVQQDFADPTMDVFGFGILLYELVSGQNPYANLTDRTAFIKAQREGTLEPPRLHAFAYQAPEEFAQLVRDCTLRDATERPTVDAILQRLDTLEARLRRDGATAKLAPASEPFPTTERDETVKLDASPPTRESAEATERMDVLPRASEAADATVRMDAAKTIAAKRRRAPLDEIGDWAARGRQSSGGSGAGAVAAAHATVVGEISAPAAKPVELAFARPPELRPVPAPPAAEPDPNLPTAGVDSEQVPNEQLGPEVADDPGPVTSGRGWLWGLGGVALALGLVAALWVASDNSSSDQQTEKADEAIAAESGPSDAPLVEPELASHESETGVEGSALEPVPEVETTGGPAPEVEVEPKIKTKPDPRHKSNPKHTPDTNGDPQEADPQPDPTCDGVETDGRAAFDAREWRKVAKLTARKACWPSNNERVRLRVEALYSLGDWTGCADAGEGSKDAKVRTMAEECQAAATALQNSESP